MQLSEQLLHRKLRGEAGDKIDEVRAFKSQRLIAIPGREAHIGKRALKRVCRERQVLLGSNIATGGDEDLRHGSGLGRRCARRRHVVGARALDRHSDLARAADGPGLAHGDPDPRDGKFGEDELGKPLGQRLDEIE